MFSRMFSAAYITLILPLCSTALPITEPQLQPQKIRIVRLDRDGFEEVSLKPFEFQLDPPIDSGISSSVAAPKTLLANQSFTFNLRCENVTKVECDGVGRALRLAGKKIAEIISFKKQVVVDATYGSFCPPVNPNCTEGRKLGSALAASYFAGTRAVGSKQVKLYPQALVKQMSATDDLPFGNVDIRAQFNSKVDFFFPKTRANASSMTKDQFDLVYVAAHELTHGLGMATSLLDIGPIFEMGTGYLVPNMFGEGFTQFDPVSVYDSYLKGSVAVEDLVLKISKFPAQSLTRDRFIAELSNSTDFSLPAKQLYQGVTKGDNALSFQTDIGPRISVFTPKLYQQGSSLSHVPPAASETEDFLMIPGLQKGVSLEAIMKEQQTDKIYGLQTVAIMEQLGYSTRANPKLATFKVAPLYGTNQFVPTTNGSITDSCLGLLLAALMYLIT